MTKPIIFNNWKWCILFALFFSVDSAISQNHQSVSKYIIQPFYIVYPQAIADKGSYTFAVRPRQIVTIRLKTQSKVEYIKPLMASDNLAPPSKREALNSYKSDKKDHHQEGIYSDNN